jgi:hypothetical protein
MNEKPQRANFTSDDAFGEAYGHWMANKPKSAPKPVARPAPQVAPTPGNPQRPPMPARFEADRDTWNHSTKARFVRAAAAEAATKAKPSSQ